MQHCGAPSGHISTARVFVRVLLLRHDWVMLQMAHHLDKLPFWPMVLTLIGPAVLVSAFARHDLPGVYAAGVIVTLIGWSQLAHWLKRFR